MQCCDALVTVETVTFKKPFQYAWTTDLQQNSILLLNKTFSIGRGSYVEAT